MKVYLIHTINGKFMEKVCVDKKTAQEECDKLQANFTSTSFTYYEYDLLGDDLDTPLLQSKTNTELEYAIELFQEELDLRK